MNAQVDWIESVPRSRNSDPITSIMAEDRMKKTGAAKSQREILYRLVCEYPGRTSAELSVLAIAAGHKAINRHAAAKRLPELREEGRIYNPVDAARILVKRTCSEKRTVMMVWMPSEGQRVAA